MVKLICIITFSLFICSISYSQSAIEYNNKGTTKHDLEDYSGAITEFTKAIQINPRYAEAYLGRGAAKRKLEDYRGAISDFNKAILDTPVILTPKSGHIDPL